MPILDVATYERMKESVNQRCEFTKAAVTVVAAREYSLFRASGLPAGAASGPGTTPVNCTSATTGALTLLNSTSTQRIVKLALLFATTTAYGLFMLHDRICHSSGLSGTTVGAQTINTPAFPARITSGKGVLAAVHIWVTIGATATRVRLTSYTDDTGTAGKVGNWTGIGATGFRDPPRQIALPLANGGEGINSVETMELEATTGTVGDFGLVLYKTLLALPFHALGPALSEEESFANLGGVAPVVPNDACLFATVVMSGTSTGAFQGILGIAEE